MIDTTAAKALQAFEHKLHRSGTVLGIAGAKPAIRRTLLAAGLRDPRVHYAANVADARLRLEQPPVTAA